MGDAQYRRAGPDDLSAIVDLHVDVWRTTYRTLAPPAAFQALGPDKRRAGWTKTLAAADQATLIATLENNLVGFISVGPASQAAFGDAGEVKHLYVASAAARRGIGQTLLSLGFDHLRNAGHTKAALAVVQGNTQAEAFYTAQGGQVTGHFTDAGPLWRSDNIIYSWDLD
ncbi:MAG: GNAT family N-acetyltransferase [Pseudomonadota bacterium]